MIAKKYIRMSKAVLPGISFLLLLLSACTGLRNVSDNKHLYTKLDLVIDSSQLLLKPKSTKQELKDLVLIKPNTKLLWMRPSLCLHGLIPETTRDSGFWHWMKYKLGSPPAYVEDVNPANVATTMENRLQNHGHFLAKAKGEIISGKKTAKLKFTVSPGRPYILKSITYPDGKDGIEADIHSTRKESILKPGSNYELKDFEDERLRIEGDLKEKGYFYFNADYLLFVADSTTASREINVSLKVKEDIPARATTKFRLKDIYVFDDYSIRDYNPDTMRIGNYQYVSEKHLFKPEAILNSVYLEADSVYSRSNHFGTIRHLMNLGVYKFATARFAPDDSLGDRLRANILLTPFKKLSISTEVNANTKSTGFAGPGVKLSYKDRNLFRGAELLAVTLGGSFETQFSGSSKGQTSYQVVLQASLTLPRFVPFHLGKEASKYSFPKTIFTSGVGIYSRVNLYDLRSFNVSLGYSWRSGERISHLFRPIDISYTILANSTADFEKYLQENPNVRRSFDNQFIIGASYNFAYTASTKHTNFYLNETVDLSGNLVSLLTSLGNAAAPTPENPRKLLGQPYSQFVRLRNEVRYLFHVSQTNLFGLRLIIGAGLPYTNSTTMPYNKQYFAGGPSSIRAFFARSLGPGTYKVPDSLATVSIDQAGDINLETNIEYRFDIYKNLKGALFTDAGNIWLVNKDPQRPGGEFNVNTFYKQLAVGSGVGFRLDFTFIILRFDMAFALRKPYLPEGQEWVIDKINFGSSSWRNDNIIWNLAIGYPF